MLVVVLHRFAFKKIHQFLGIVFKSFGFFSGEILD